MDTEQPQHQPRIRSWSFSAVKLFEQCPYAARLRHADRVPGPERDERHPLERGNRYHRQLEQYIKGEINALPKWFNGFKTEIERLREGFSDGVVLVEDGWGFDDHLNSIDWFDSNVWLRVKLDALEFHDETAAVAIDLKSGKKYGNEVKHNQQGQLYALASFIRFPKLEQLRTEFWYPDQQKRTKKDYSRVDVAKYLPRWIEKGTRITTATAFPPKPNAHNCKYCDYGRENGTGYCVYAVESL